jgi:4-amino-4-deoxy-L-arabinose transferase-like glycosyltransferase
VLLAAAVAVRAWGFWSIELNHFDEGVYVFSALGLSDPAQPMRLFPLQAHFSPPVYFGLVALLFEVLGRPSALAAIALNVGLGTGTVTLVWWVGRAWFGPSAGMASAALLAFNTFHIALSRTALSDVAFAASFVGALALLTAAIQRGRIDLSVLAGVAVGIAWNTKYHGWFALVIGAGALLLSQWRRGRSRAAFARAVTVIGVAGVVAAACYLPWALFVQSQPGGYAGLAAYQRTMLDPDWFENLFRQAGMQAYFEGPLSRCAPVLAVLSAGLVTGNRSWRMGSFVVLLFGTAAAALFVSVAGASLLMTLAALPRLVGRSSTADGVLMAWLGLWFVTTPAYHPYARLVLPFTIATHLGAGAWLESVLSRAATPARSRPWAITAAGAAAIVLVLILSWQHGRYGPWRPSRSMAEAVAEVASIVPPGERVVVIGEPALAFYLHLTGRPAFERMEQPEQLAREAVPVYVVTGIYAKWAPSLRDGLAALGARLEPIRSFSFRPNDVRLLDDFAPQQALDYLSHPDDRYDLTLYRFVPGMPGTRY